MAGRAIRANYSLDEKLKITSRSFEPGEKLLVIAGFMETKIYGPDCRIIAGQADGVGLFYWATTVRKGDAGFAKVHQLPP